MDGSASTLSIGGRLCWLLGILPKGIYYPAEGTILLRRWPTLGEICFEAMPLAEIHGERVLDEWGLGSDGCATFPIDITRTCDAQRG